MTIRPLAGVKVLDFTTLLPGPLATLILAEAGASVMKVERADGGDDMRGYEPKLGPTSAMFALLNRGKTSIALDLKNSADQARALGMATTADIVVEQFRPGVMDRLGLGYEAVARLNPKIVYCSITGYGQSGPKANDAGHDMNFAAEAGLLSVVADRDGAPPPLPAPIADIVGGAYPAVMNILLALRERDASGRGRHLDVAMSDNMFPLLVRALASGFRGVWQAPNADLLTGATPRYANYRTRDGRYVTVAALEDRFWRNLCALLGVSEDAQRADVAKAIAQRDAQDWAAAFAGRDVCCSVVATVEEALASPHVAARGLFTRRVENAGGEIPALPLPLVEAYRDPERGAASPE